MSEYFAQKRSAIARYDVPAPLAREIGRFVVIWAHLEHYIQVVIWNALEISEYQGRLAVKEPRVTERLDMLRDLGEVQNLAIDFVLLKEIRPIADYLASKRNLLAHSIWQKLDNEWCVIITRGSWQEMPVEIADYPEGVSKNLEPQAVPITVDDVRNWIEQTTNLIEQIKSVGDQHRLVPLPEKRKKRSVPKGQKSDRNGSRHKSPHQSSRG